MAAITYWHNDSATASTTDYNICNWVTAGTDITCYTIQLGFQGFIQGIDYVHEKINEIFDNRARIKQYRKTIFTDKVKQSLKIIKKQSYTIMIPSKRNFRGKDSKRR